MWPVLIGLKSCHIRMYVTFCLLDSEIEPVAKKPKFEERKITSFVYKSNWYDWKRVHSARAIDVATGKEAKGQNEKKKHKAIELARANLKKELLKEGSISN